VNDLVKMRHRATYSEALLSDNQLFNQYR